jgi:plasmid stabilization system protein ParE
VKRYRLIISNFAESDLKMAADWYASQKAGLDLDFVEEIEKAIQRIQDNPRLFAVVRKQVRMSVVSGFLMVFTSTSLAISLTYLRFSILAETLKFCENE